MKKRLFSYIIFFLAGLILILGIIQLILYISPQLELITSARLQETPEQDISNYFWQKLMPEIISYIIIFIGFVSVLFVSGMIWRKLEQIRSNVNVPKKEKNTSKNTEDLDDKDFFEDFDAVESESKPEEE